METSKLGLRTLLTAVAIVVSQTAFSVASANESSRTNATKLVQWWDYYQNLPLLGGPQPLRGKYDSASVPSGMQQLVEESLERNIEKLPQVQRQALSKYQVSVAHCSKSGPSLMSAVDSSSKKICVAPILVASLYFNSVGTDVARFHRQLTRWNLDPSSITVAYDPNLNKQGVTKDDWQGILTAFNAEWEQMQGSVDMLLSYLVSCDIFSNNSADCGERAAVRAKSISGQLEMSALDTVLKRTASKYGAEEWGFRTAGDGVWVARHISSIKQARNSQP